MAHAIYRVSDQNHPLIRRRYCKMRMSHYVVFHCLSPSVV